MSSQTGREKAWAELAGIPQSGYNDVFMRFSSANGWTGSFNDRMVQYLKSITGSSSNNLPDLQQLVANLLGVGDWDMVGYDIISLSGGSFWILASSSWNDAGDWLDAAVWND